MSKSRMEEAAIKQVGEVRRDVAEDHRELKGQGKQTREERLVIRLSKEELKRINTHCRLINLPVSTWARAELLASVRRG